jgi:hypothetical protein
LKKNFLLKQIKVHFHHLSQFNNLGLKFEYLTYITQLQSIVNVEP